MEPTFKVADEFPDVKFEHATVQTSPNMGIYDSLLQVTYLSGQHRGRR